MVTSLRRQLLAWILPVLLVAAIAAAFATYLMFGWSVRYFMDSQLRVFADSHADAAGAVPALRSLTAYNVEKGDLIVQIWERDRLLASSWPALQLRRWPEPGFHDVMANGARWRIYVLHSAERTVQSVQSLEFRQSVVRNQALRAGLPVVLLMPISAVILWFAIRRALQRLAQVAQVAAAQDETSFGELPIENVPTEIRPLVQAVNTLLMRLRAAFTSQRQFVHDAAHELRTPITAMHLQLENLKTLSNDPESVAQQIKLLEAGLARARRLVEQLLRLARQEAPRAAESRVVIRLGEFLKSIIADAMTLADHRAIDLGFVASVDAEVEANPDELRSLLHNLLDNALRYTPVGGVVDVTLQVDRNVVTATIVDTGPGIPPEHLPRVFDRFFRVVGTAAEGSGLGLAIAKSAAERNGLVLELANRNDGAGLIARVRFPHAEHVSTRAAELSPA